MNQRVKLACLLTILVWVTACARATPVAIEPTRTPKPTFTIALASPSAVSVRTVTSATDTPYPTAVATPTKTAYVTAATKPTGTASTAAKPTSTASPPAVATPTRTAYSAPAGTRTLPPTPTRKPTPVRPTPTPTRTPRPTSTLPPMTPTPTPLACSAGYEKYSNTQLGFSACYPTGWAISTGEDAEHAAKWVNFASPTMDINTGAGMKIISVSTTPPITGSSEDEILEKIGLDLVQRYEKALIGWPHGFLMDGQKVVEGHYEGSTLIGQTLTAVTGWELIFVAGDKTWTIHIAGLLEYKEELQRIHDEFVPRFHLLSP